MCKYCIDIGKDEGEDLEFETIAKPINLGDIGDFGLSLSIGKGFLGDIVMFIGFGREMRSDILTKQIQIKYCPFCGRRLKA